MKLILQKFTSHELINHKYIHSLRRFESYFFEFSDIKNYIVNYLNIIHNNEKIINFSSARAMFIINNIEIKINKIESKKL